VKKFLHVTYGLESGSEEGSDSVLLEGDHRQDNERMLELLAERKLGEHFEQSGEDEDPPRYEAEGEALTIEDFELVSSSEAEELKSSTFTLVVNENVTEPVCRVSYSGRTAGLV